jgi:ribosome biogenesis protein ENP2
LSQSLYAWFLLLIEGYFVDFRLYEKAKAIANPYEFSDFKSSEIQRKIQEKNKSRIIAINKLPKINKKMAAKLILEEEDPKDSKKKKQIFNVGTDDNPLGDDRFASLFKDAEYQIDETSHEYKLHHPSESQRKVFKPIEEENDDSSGSDDNALRNIRHRKPKMYQLEDEDVDLQFMQRVEVFLVISLGN